MASPTQWTWVWVNSGRWRAAIHGVAKSRTWLSDWTELNFQIFEEFCRYLVVTDFYFDYILFRERLEIQSLEIYLDLFYGLVYDLCWGMLHMHLRRVCILLLLGGMLAKCKLDQVTSSIVQIPYILTNLSICQLQREESHVPQPWFSFSSVNFCFTYFGALLLGTTFRFICLG